ncbi:uncharacterized protein [Taeniopygia guttata]|uniref:uncharacterized protein isoform X2 n=1 Tax=Taeniopygia guttata TaxID=59729 RepID=UPI003BB8EAC2
MAVLAARQSPGGAAAAAIRPLPFPSGTALYLPRGGPGMAVWKRPTPSSASVCPALVIAATIALHPLDSRLCSPRPDQPRPQPAHAATSGSGTRLPADRPSTPQWSEFVTPPPPPGSAFPLPLPAPARPRPLHPPRGGAGDGEGLPGYLGPSSPAPLRPGRGSAGRNLASGAARGSVCQLPSKEGKEACPHKRLIASKGICCLEQRGGQESPDKRKERKCTHHTPRAVLIRKTGKLQATITEKVEMMLDNASLDVC